MQWLNELPFADNRVLQIGFLAACGIAALIVLAIVYRLAFAHRLRVPGGRTRQPRLGLVDAFSLDGQRQLVLIRRDNIEHLVMIGGPNDVLVEFADQSRRGPGARDHPGLAFACAKHARAAAPPCVSGCGSAREGHCQGPSLIRPRRPCAGPTMAAPVTPAVVAPLAPIPAPAALTPPSASPPVSKAPAPAQPPPPPSPSFVPIQAAAPEPARPPVAAPATTEAPAEPARSPPASAPPRQADPRPAQPRATMPPPIIPANASPNRGAAARATETAFAKGPGAPPAASPVAPLQPRRPEKAEAAAVGSKADLNVTTARIEPLAASTGTASAAGQCGLVPSAAHAEDALVCTAV